MRKARLTAFICFFIFFGISRACAINLEKVRASVLNGDYKEAIAEGEKLMANTGRDTKDLDELYYLLGLSYMKDGNVLRASDIFEIILNELKGSRLKEEAELGLADTYLLRENYKEAQARYKKLAADAPKSRLITPIYYRLSICASRLGDISEAKDYALKSGVEAVDTLPDTDFYSVQVGSFAKDTNANSLAEKLSARGYPAFVEEMDLAAQGDKVYRVKVGKLKSIAEAQELEKKLIQDGYPTKISP